MTLTANGFFEQASEKHPIPNEILTDFGGFIMKYQNLVNGRKTFDMIRQGPSMSLFKAVELVVISQQLQDAKDFQVVKSPKEALDYLDQKNFSTALIAGGAQLNSSFLSEGLVDELYLNIAPTLVNTGINLSLKYDREHDLELMDTNKLGEHIMQLHYKIIK